MKIFTQQERILAGILAFGLILGYIVKFIRDGFSDEAQGIVQTGVDSSIVNFYSKMGNLTDKKESEIRPIGDRGKMVNINTATENELELLPGIGPTLAKRIIIKRKELNQFKAIDDLIQVKGIGDKLFLKIHPFISIGGNIE